MQQPLPVSEEKLESAKKLSISTKCKLLFVCQFYHREHRAQEGEKL